MNEIRMIDVNKIIPDKNQPRQIWHEEELKELSQNIKQNGVIVPIEIDENNVIVCGERRYRAAKLAGLQQVPCFYTRKVFKNAHERFVHQFCENVNHSTMNPIDTAKALLAISDEYDKTAKRKGNYHYKYAIEVTGLSMQSIRNFVSCLSVDHDMQKAIEKGEVNYQMADGLKYVPEKYKERIKEKILKGEIRRHTVLGKLKSALRNSPQTAEKLLDEDLSKELSALRKIDDAYPSEQRVVREATASPEDSKLELLKTLRKLDELLDVYPLDLVPPAYRMDTVQVITKITKKLTDQLRIVSADMQILDQLHE